MMKLTKTSLKKNKIISKLLAPLQTKYRMESSGGIEMPEDIMHEYLFPYLDNKSYCRFSTTQRKYPLALWPTRQAGDRLLLNNPSLLGNSMYAGGLKRKNEYLKRKNEYLELEKEYSDPEFIENFDNVTQFVEYLLDKRPKNVQDIYKIIEYKNEWVQKDINETEIKNEIKQDYSYEAFEPDLDKIKYLLEEIGIETDYLLYVTVVLNAMERITDKDLINIIKYLVKKGADINYVPPYEDDEDDEDDKSENTLLLISILNDRFDLVKYLVENGAVITETEINHMKYKIEKNYGTELTEGEEKILTYLKKKYAEQQKSS